jgi:hypothetical protein
MGEVYRRLAHYVGRRWIANNGTIVVLALTYRVSAGFLLIQVLSLAALLWSSIA